MGTEPNKDILPEYWDEGNNLKKLLSQFSDLIDECVNFGTHVLDWIQDSLKGKKEYPSAIILLIRHLLEVSIAISKLVEKSLIDPAKILLRAQLETSMHIRYLIEKDFKKRSFAYLTVHLIEKKKLYDKFNPKTELGKQFSAEMKGTKLEDIEVPKDIDLDEKRENVNELLKKNGYKEAYNEYKRVKQLFNKVYFYTLYEELQSIEALSEYLGMKEQYETIYRSYSKKVHSTDVITGVIGSDESGQSYANSLKNPSHAQYVTFFTINYLLEIYRPLIKRFRDDKYNQLEDWYRENVEDEFIELSNRNN